MPPIRGHKVLVIGGSSGIGAAVAKLAGQEGASVAIASSNPTRVENAVQKLRAAVPEATFSGYTVDVNQDDVEERLDKLFADVTAGLGGQLDHIVYTANVIQFTPLSSVTVPFLRSNVQFGYVVPLILAKLAPKYVRSSYTSSITFTTGRAAERPVKGVAALAGIGAGLFGITRSLALELAPVRVNLVSPGTTDTDIFGPPEVRAPRLAEEAKNSLLGKVAAPEEVAEAYIYYMKDTNNTGSHISTSGGALIQ
ncbi:hypothetical protein MYCTH_2308119 [Thermothelomyces thermophilus ATCC 42464]|uniref:Uncharacterized protein n=1 Tax=Thermothelomyces thermophilus (strain ATCC 42464 / BCRC 31852 / DSM 1799) TaxID=573729 RepID=G2QJA0_THET4|nr:uncharacterized protein MYCTH_2308119 [Thermothelomyces thermophilus ATCC 42464]AEO59657.1 hypothetical protein MYCTH_2308119 [Thermothelomyces thermophilus ATCC 42464]